MIRFAILLIFVLGCDKGISSKSSGSSAPSSASMANNETAKSGDATKPAPAATPAWDPGTPVDYKTLNPRSLFVVAERTSVCPTKAQARARECGNTVEEVTQGQSFPVGSAITVVGDGTENGLWRAIRFQKAGTLPGWVRADDLAETPKLPALDAFDARPELKNAVDGTSKSASDIAKLKKGTFVVWLRHKGIGLGVDDTIYVPAKTGVVAVQYGGGLDKYMNNHGCLVNADCLTLDYECEKDGYCDEVSVLARVTGKTIAKPEDEYGVWPAEWKANKLPQLEAIALADRFGLYANP